MLLTLLSCRHQLFHIGDSLLHQLIIPEVVDGVDVLTLHFIVHDQLIHSNKAAIFLDAESNALVSVHPFGRNLVIDFQGFFHCQMVVELSRKRKLQTLRNIKAERFLRRRSFCGELFFQNFCLLFSHRIGLFPQFCRVHDPALCCITAKLCQQLCHSLLHRLISIRFKDAAISLRKVFII